MHELLYPLPCCEQIAGITRGGWAPAAEATRTGPLRGLTQEGAEGADACGGDMAVRWSLVECTVLTVSNRVRQKDRWICR